MQLPPFMPLRGTICDYAWGRAHTESLISRLAAAQAALPAVCDGPLAELWLGAHPRGVATVEIGDETKPLDSLIAAHPEEILGAEAVRRFGSELPFLFKVLTVRSALSIQVHPDVSHAARLHAAEPSHYPDPHHKPEFAFALSPVSLLYGFRPAQQIARFLESEPELRAVAGEEASERYLAEQSQDALRYIYRRILHASSAQVAAASKSLYDRIDRSPTLPEHHALRKLRSEYPDGDPGLFSFFILNLEKLEPGEGVFVAANVPHAYLEGDLVECMANSDNVIRAGLTKKHQDIEALLEVVDFSHGAPSRYSIPAGISGARFTFPIEEFYFEALTGPHGPSPLTSPANVSLVLSLDAEGSLQAGDAHAPFSPGAAFLVRANAPVDIELRSGRVFRTGVP